MSIIQLSKYRHFIKCSDDIFYLQLVGVDLSVKSISRIDSGQRVIGVISNKDTIIYEDYYHPILPVAGVYSLWPGIYSFTFEQGIELDSFHFGEIVPRSSLVRCGGIVGSGIYEPGYKTENIGAVIHLTNRVFIKEKTRVVQMKIYKGEEEFGVYNGQWSKRDIK